MFSLENRTGMPNRKCMDGTIDWEKMRCNSTEASKHTCCGVARYIEGIAVEGRASSDFCIRCRLRRFDARGVLWSREWLCF